MGEAVGRHVGKASLAEHPGNKKVNSPGPLAVHFTKQHEKIGDLLNVPYWEHLGGARSRHAATGGHSHLAHHMRSQTRVSRCISDSNCS